MLGERFGKGLYPENINETSRYVLGWEYKTTGNQSSNLVTFLWDGDNHVWKNITKHPGCALNERFSYHPIELGKSMIIVEKVHIDFFLHEKTYLTGEKEVGVDGGNW